MAAAVAALVAVLYARETVIDARQARKEASADHRDQMAEERTAMEAATAAHHEEMAERRRSLDAEVTLQRIVQVERVADVLVDLMDAARAEGIAPPPFFEASTIRATRIPGLLSRLRAALALLDALGGPPLLGASGIANTGYGGGSSPTPLIGSTLDALREIELLAHNEDRLRVDDGRDSSALT